MIRVKHPLNKPILISPQVQQPKRINPPEFENKSTVLPPAPRRYKKSKSIQTEESELISTNCNKQSSENFDQIVENLKIKFDKSQSFRYQINSQLKKTSKNDDIQMQTSNIQQQNNLNETVSFKTFIEFDMHGGDYHISDPFDWIKIIRETLNDAREHNLDLLKFIPGQGKHTNTNPNKSPRNLGKQKDPILRPLTLVATKMLGFRSYIDIANKGVVICPISSYHKIALDEAETDQEKRDLLFNVFLGIDSFDMQNEKLYKNSDDYDIKLDCIQRYKEIKRLVPNLMYNCAEIISIWKKETNEAIEFAQNFMNHFNEIELYSKSKKQLKRAKMRDDKKKEDEMINTIKLVNKYQQKYCFDREVIKRVVIEQKTEEKIEKVLDKIYHDMFLPYIFYTKNFANLVSEYETIPITSLLDMFKESEYIPTVVQRKMCSQSFTDVRKALCLMKMDTNIDSKRAYNEFFNNHRIDIPKYVPSIEINLENAGIEKAKSSISRIMDGLSLGEFCEMILIFTNDKNKNCCSIDDVRPFIEQKAKNDGYNLHENENKNKEEFHFYIINKRIAYDKEPKEEVPEKEKT